MRFEMISAMQQIKKIQSQIDYQISIIKLAGLFRGVGNIKCIQARREFLDQPFFGQGELIALFIIVIMLRTVVRSVTGRWLAPSTHFTYIRKKLLDEIQKSHGTSWTQRLLMYTKQAKLIATHGLQHFKSDMQSFSKFYTQEKVQNKPLSEEEKIQKIRIVKNLSRLKPIIFIQIMPFSAPLLIFYLFTYPTKVPTYLCLDQLFDAHQRQCVEAQKIAIKHFQGKPLHREGFSLKLLGLQELKQLSKLFYGHYEDGVVGINQYFKAKPKEYLLHPEISKHLVIKKLKQQLVDDAKNHPECRELDVDSLAIWKYDQVMRGQGFVKFEPVVKELVEEVLAAKAQQIQGQGKEAAKESDISKPSEENNHQRHKPTSSSRHSHNKQNK